MNQVLQSFTRPLLYLVLINLVPQLGLRPLWVSGVCLGMIGYRLWLERTSWRVPPRWAIWAGQIVALALVWDQYHSLLGGEAGGTLLAMLTCMKTFELKVKRDYFVTLMLCILDLMTYLLLDQGLMITFFMMVDLILIVGFLYALEHEHWNLTLARKSLKPTIALALKSLPLLLLMFVLFPRFTTGFGHNPTSAATTGVSDELRPGSVAKLVNSDELAFRATFLDGVVPQRNQLYWRGAVLDQSSGINWTRSKQAARSPLYATPPQNPDMEIYLEPGNEKFLFAPENTQAIGFPNELIARHVSVREGQTFELEEPLQTRERYYVQRFGGTGAEDFKPEPYLKVAEEPSPELKKFLKKYEKEPPGQAVHDLLENFREGGYRYSLSPPPVSTLNEFMFGTKTGFCEHFAATMGTLLRYLKIPSRVVVGFQGGTPSYFENYITVRGQDAHAWVEYYDSTVQRWHRVDPTAEVEPLRISTEGQFLFGRASMPAWMPGQWFRWYMRSRAFADEVEADWTGFLLHFDLARQKELLSKMGMEGVWFRALAVFLLLSLGLILSVLYFFESQRREPVSEDERIYRQLLKLLRKWKIEKSPSEGPLRLFAKVSLHSLALAGAVEPVLMPLILARYGGVPLTANAIRTLRVRLRAIRRLKP